MLDDLRIVSERITEMHRQSGLHIPGGHGAAKRKKSEIPVKQTKETNDQIKDAENGPSSTPPTKSPQELEPYLDQVFVSKTNFQLFLDVFKFLTVLNGERRGLKTQREVI